MKIQLNIVMPRLLGLLLLGGVSSLMGCGADNTSDPQLPPTTGHVDVEAWLAKGYYKAWHCEAAPHAARAPSPHGTDRVCSNDLLSGAGAGEFPAGSAGVKEVLDNVGNVAGYAVYRHAKAGTTADTWYWYERAPGGFIAADNFGDQGVAKSFCVSCHTLAGSDPNHSGHDFVYTQVK